MKSAEASREEQAFGNYLYLHDNFINQWVARKKGNTNYHLQDRTQEGIRIKIAVETIIQGDKSA